MIRTALTLAALVATTSASATAVTAANADINLRITGFAYGYAAVDTTANTGYIGAGELRGEQIGSSGAATSFLTYCTDIYQAFTWNATERYTLVDNGTTQGFTLRQADLLGKLYTLAGQAVDTVDESAAFQLAVWEIVTETDASLGITSGNFRLERGATRAQRTLTDTWLAAVSDVNAARSFNAQRLFNPSTQDFVVFTEIPVPRLRTTAAILTVPEPSSYALTGLALASLALLRRRRR